MSTTNGTFTDLNASLALELIDQILSHLSPRHLINTALVCRSWATLTRRRLCQDVYIHTNRQYTRWLETLEATSILHRQLVRRIVIHPQVHLDLCDLAILHLCPWVESFDIDTKSCNKDYSKYHTFNINGIIGNRHRYPQLLHHWRYLKRLHGYYSDPPTAWLRPLQSPLVILVCSYDDICTLAIQPGGSTVSQYLYNSTLRPWQPSCVLSDLVDLQVTFGCLDVPMATLEMIHLVCPALENLKLHGQSIYGSTPPKMIGDSRATSNSVDGDDDLQNVSPAFSLKTLSLNDMVYFDPGCYPYLLRKYPLLATLHLGFAFDEFYVSPLLNQQSALVDDDDFCIYLRKNRLDLFALISGYIHLTRLEIHLQGANEYVTSLWPSEKMAKWMQYGNNDNAGYPGTTTRQRTCGLQHLEMTYQRQSTKYSHDILGLDGMINSWVGQHQLQTLLLDVYNNGRNKDIGNGRSTDTDTLAQLKNHNRQHTLQSTLDSYLYSDGFLAVGSHLLRNMTTLCIKCFPGFDVSLPCLLEGLPGLRILDLSFGKIISRKAIRSQLPSASYGLRQLILGSSSVMDTVHFMELIQHYCQQLATLSFENVLLGGTNGEIGDSTTAESKRYVWDLSNHGLNHVWIKYLSVGSNCSNTGKNEMVNCLKIHETTANRSTVYHTSLAQGTHGSSRPFGSYYGLPCDVDDFENSNITLDLKCYFVEDILFC